MVLTLVFLDPRAGVVRGVVVPILAVDAVALALFGFLFLRRGIRIIWQNKETSQLPVLDQSMLVVDCVRAYRCVPLWTVSTIEAV